MTTPAPTLAARMAELPIHWHTITPRKHRHGEELAQIVYADPGVSGWYYRDRKPDSVAAYVRLDLLTASNFITLADAEAMVRAENEACAETSEQIGRGLEEDEYEDNAVGAFDAATAIRARVKPHNNEVA